MEEGSRTIEVEVLFFARARDLAGCNRATLALAPRENVGQLVKRLVRDHPQLAGFIDNCRIAVDEEFADASKSLCAGSIVAIIPPVSGG